MLKKLSEEAIQLAREQVNKYNVPEMLHLDISLEKGVHLAETLGANTEIVKIGVAFMDLKLGQAFHEKKIPSHIDMSIEFVTDFLKDKDISNEDKDNIISCVKEHHGRDKFYSLEAEICANADCYRFCHPKGIFFYFTVLGKRMNNFFEIAKQVEAKMDEKYNILSLPEAKNELSPIYKNMKQYFSSL